MSIAYHVCDLGHDLCLSFFVKKRVKNINVEIKYDNICNVLYLYEILVAILTSFCVFGYRESGLVFKYPINS